MIGVKIRIVLGPEPEDDKEVTILSRIACWAASVLLYEANPRHVEKLLRAMGMKNLRPLGAPGIKMAGALRAQGKTLS